ncbi:MAG: 30S ribosomal protein S15 [Candidatus Woesearchaeota archaeon]
MARMHSGAKGKSGSKRPGQKAEFVSYSAKEVEMLVAKLAKEGMSGSLIGLTLRDTYGIPNVQDVTGKPILQLLEEKKLTPELPEDLLALIKKAVQVNKHLQENKQDKTARRGLQLTTSKIFRLTKYYKSTGKLDKSWKFKVEDAGYYIQ